MNFLCNERLRGEAPIPATLKGNLKTDTFVEFHYFEIEGVDSTAIIVAIFDKGKMVKIYSEFDAQDFYEDLEDVDLNDAEAVIDGPKSRRITIDESRKKQL